MNDLEGCARQQIVYDSLSLSLSQHIHRIHTLHCFTSREITLHHIPLHHITVNAITITLLKFTLLCITYILYTYTYINIMNYEATL